MCLTTITKREDEMPSAAIGYKIVKVYADQYYPAVRFFYCPGPRGNGWGIPDDAPMIEDKGVAYLAGVHSYTNVTDAAQALKWWHDNAFCVARLVKVYLRGPICEGVGDGLGHQVPVTVYREMRIIKEVS